MHELPDLPSTQDLTSAPDLPSAPDLFSAPVLPSAPDLPSAPQQSHPEAASTTARLGTSGVARRPLGPQDSARASRLWWDADADDYHREHGAFLGEADFVWCPEGLREATARLLGPAGSLAGRRILEIGAGSAPCARWLRGEGARVVASDLSGGMLRHARDAAGRTGLVVPLVQADAQRLPFADASFDIAFSAFGAVPFVADSAAVMREAARVLVPGGRWVFATTHPIRWCFPDDPGPDGLTASMPYFDRTPYVEFDDAGSATYVEHHRTLGDRVREIVGAGLILEDIVEPQWPPSLTQSWGQWSPLRGALIPGTTIFVCSKPGPAARASADA